MSLILASKSPARAGLLQVAGVPFEVRGSGVDEEPLKAEWTSRGWHPAAVAKGLARAKALAVSAGREDLVVGADQTLEFRGQLIDKPADVAEARARLLDMRGEAHALHSAVVLCRGGEVVWEELASARLHLRRFSEAWLDSYLAAAGPEVLHTVGAYQVEGLGVQLFDRIEGDWPTILGLPLLGLLQALRERGVLAS